MLPKCNQNKPLKTRLEWLDGIPVTFSLPLSFTPARTAFQVRSYQSEKMRYWNIAIVKTFRCTWQTEVSPLRNVLWWFLPTRRTRWTPSFSSARWEIKLNLRRVFIDSVWRWSGRHCLAVEGWGGGGVGLWRVGGRAHGLLWPQLLITGWSSLHFVVCEDGLC